MTVPDNFARTIIGVHGDAGRRWLAGLPALIEYCARRWALRVEPPFPELSYNYAAPATGTAGEPLVLKLGVPHPELTSEIAALRHYDGRGAVQLLAADDARGVLLLERLQPGRMLSELEDDDVATAIAAQVMRGLWRPPPEEGVERFRTVEQWASGMQRLREEFDGGCGPFPRRLVEQAETLFAELLPSEATPVLLHGDLHHYNILSAGEDKWLAIDPKGVLGEPAYEVGALMRNPFGVRNGQTYPGGSSAGRTYWPTRWAWIGSASWAGAWHRRCCRHGGHTRTAGRMTRRGWRSWRRWQNSRPGCPSA